MAMIVLVGHSYYQNSDINLLKFDKIITETESNLEEGFLGTKDKIFLSQEYHKLQNAKNEYQGMLNQIENTLSNAKLTNMKNHLDKDTQIKQHIEDTEYVDDKLFQIKQHRQNNKLNNLEQKIEEYNEKLAEIGVDDIGIKSAKSQAEPVNLNMQRISEGETPDNDEYIIFANNQCLSYDKDEESENTYKLAFCNRSDPKLSFKVNSIGDVEEYNRHVSGNDKITSDYVIGFPFSIIKPNNVGDKCLTLDEEGISVQPCNLSEYQMWHTSSYNKACKN